MLILNCEVVVLPKARSPDRDKAFEIYKANRGEIKLCDIAVQLGVAADLLRKWKRLDKWDDRLPQRMDTKMCSINENVSIQKADKKLIASVESNEELTDQRKEFCLYYVQIFNATQAAIRAGYSPRRRTVLGITCSRSQLFVKK